MKKTVLVILLLVAGICLLLYPTARGLWLDTNSATAVDEFVCERATEETPYAELKEEMEQYNRRIYEEHQAGLNESRAYEQSFDMASHGIMDGMVGVIETPTVHVTLPLYLGASNANLAKGAAVLGETSMPIGGENTNCVIAGHRGYQGADFFRYVPDLEVGDTVRIINLWDVLEYRVTEKQIIGPHEVKKVFIQEGKDMVTLLTCHPYGGGGRERYVIYCERIPGKE